MLGWLLKVFTNKNVGASDVSDVSDSDQVIHDKYGQNELHKVAHSGANELASLLATNKFDINQGDNQGRTALHIAAAVDNFNGVELLRNNKGHEEAAKVLLDYGADVVSHDNSGQSILSLMVMNMPILAEEGLNQLYKHNPDTHQTQYQLRYLEPIYNNTLKACYSRRIMQFIVYYKLHNLARHPVIQKFVDIKWNFYGHTEAVTLLLANIIFLVSWSFLLCVLTNEMNQSGDFRMEMWLFLFGCFCISELIYLIGLEFLEYFELKKIFRLWKWQQQEALENDLQYCSPIWPQEEAFLKNKLKELNEMKSIYRITLWRLYNWVMYVLLMFIVYILTVDVILKKDSLRYHTEQIIAITLILLWLRNLKYLQTFRFIGPFILMFQKIGVFILEYLFIFTEMIIAFILAFRIIFMGESQETKTFESLLFIIFKVTIVHQYGYEVLHRIDPIMTYILVCLLIFGSIICNNLLIAMLTKTFIRMEDERSTNLVMERLTVLVQRDKSWLFYFDRLASHYYICKLGMPLTIHEKDGTTASSLKCSLITITEELHEIEVFLKTRMIDFKGIDGILKRKQEERYLAAIEYKVNILQKKLIKIAQLKEKKNKLIFLQLEMLLCLLERMKAST
ncbi:uncharacterized protein LOC119967674 isoform X2 [Scyliorhinus canicula]|uniref:uncharacterized protein LOC119967674 isoform X2 n=1 Tax=Scyliorhinus canicula TaxID=7830 RepID=UPI0018F67C62|nr:uncharacterized protein LOC119967674 isoform X2 [Scyliorhinus canicula]